MPKVSSSLASRLKKAAPKSLAKLQPSPPLWKGPCDNGPLGGITQSMLGTWIVDRERFRIRYILGLQTPDAFERVIEYGNMWHVCEEAIAKQAVKDRRLDDPWVRDLKEYCRKLCKRYPLQQEEIDKWYRVCKCQFPSYVDYWKKHPDVSKRDSLLEEYVFHVPYRLPSGRIIWLRGKFDSVDVVKTGDNSGIWLQENKTKSEINEHQLLKQLRFDLQTMLYLTALREMLRNNSEWLPKITMLGVKHKLKGVRYNVIKRPLSGGSGSIRQHKPSKANPQGESKDEFYARLGGYFAEDPASWFMRWNVDISDADIDKYEKTFLIPCLEQLCEWYTEVTTNHVITSTPSFGNFHYRTPYGIWNPLLNDAPTELDEYLDTGSTVGLIKADGLFGELQT